jgi:hypothetical protein
VALADGVARAAPGRPVIGCSTRIEIAPDGPGDGSVVVTANGGPGTAVSTAADEAITGPRRVSQLVHDIAAQIVMHRVGVPTLRCQKPPHLVR